MSQEFHIRTASEFDTFENVRLTIYSSLGAVCGPKGNGLLQNFKEVREAGARYETIAGDSCPHTAGA